MTTKVFLVHGWSVSETKTYQALHERLSKNGYDLKDVFLGRYVSLDNDVEVRDVARALQNELARPHCLGKGAWKEPFHIITHSTGALVVKQWIVEHYKGKWAARKPLKNVVFLAGPHFGSRLAHHGRSMLAHARYWGDTGKEILTALELGSKFSWANNAAWLTGTNWKAKGIRPYCLIGDRVKKDFFQSKIFPAGFEEGSDMVVRVPAGNLNFKRYRFDLASGQSKVLGEITGIPFAALEAYTHSGPGAGIMNSIKSGSTPATHQALKLILRCLSVKSAADYKRVEGELAAVTKRTRNMRQGFAQLDFSFRDNDGMPVTDYSFVLGAIVNEKRKPSKTIAHTHKNNADGSRFTVFINLKQFESKLTYYMDLTANTATSLVSYPAVPRPPEFSGLQLRNVIREDEVTQIEVVLGRVPRRELFIFHRGDDADLHVEWNRDGVIQKTGIAHE